MTVVQARNIRHAVRHRRRFRVTLGRTSAFTIDVGLGGFCIEMLRVLPVGTPVEGCIRVNDRELTFAGHVAWAKPGDINLGLRGRMGVRFQRVDQALRNMGDSAPAAG